MHLAPFRAPLIREPRDFRASLERPLERPSYFLLKGARCEGKKIPLLAPRSSNLLILTVPRRMLPRLASRGARRKTSQPQTRSASRDESGLARRERGARLPCGAVRRARGGKLTKEESS